MIIKGKAKVTGCIGYKPVITLFNSKKIRKGSFVLPGIIIKRKLKRCIKAADNNININPVK
jgi:hypothetical protein